MPQGEEPYRTYKIKRIKKRTNYKMMPQRRAKKLSKLVIIIYRQSRKRLLRHVSPSH